MRTVEMVPVDQVKVLNPRVRNHRQHREIIENIGAIGLKRPITVTRRESGNGTRFDLVCGQGRLEAYKELGATEIPALVIDAKEEDCLIMSLVENIARRQHPAIELMRQIGDLHDRGYTEVQIAEKVGVTTSWATDVVSLLENGEERLLAAVEAEIIPVSLAVDIAKSKDKDVQTVLAEAYEQRKLRGKKLTIVRRLLEQRARRGKQSGTNFYRQRGSRRLTAEHLKRVYEHEVEKQKLLAKKADVAQTKLLFVIEALRNLRAEPAFISLLQAEGLETLPRALTDRMAPSRRV
jgi:ParB family chromosome partitioning protein